MSTTVKRLYERQENALAAAAALKSAGFADGSIRVLTAGGASASEISSSLEGAGLSSADTAACIACVAAGGGAVLVEAPFGTALEAEGILDSHGPVTAASESGSARSARLEADSRLSLGTWIPVLTSGKSSTVLLSGGSTTKLLTGRSSTKLLDGKSKTKLIDFSLSRKLGLPELTSSSSRRGR